MPLTICFTVKAGWACAPPEDAVAAVPASTRLAGIAIAANAVAARRAVRIMECPFRRPARRSAEMTLISVPGEADGKPCSGDPAGERRPKSALRQCPAGRRQALKLTGNQARAGLPAGRRRSGPRPRPAAEG